jgi:hypothetical protein
MSAGSFDAKADSSDPVVLAAQIRLSPKPFRSRPHQVLPVAPWPSLRSRGKWRLSPGVRSISRIVARRSGEAGRRRPADHGYAKAYSVRFPDTLSPRMRALISRKIGPGRVVSDKSRLLCSLNPSIDTLMIRSAKPRVSHTPEESHEFLTIRSKHQSDLPQSMEQPETASYRQQTSDQRAPARPG